MRSRVFTNVLSSSDYKPISDIIVNRSIPFYFCAGTVDEYDKASNSYASSPSHDYSYQFVNLIHNGIRVLDEEGFRLVSPILNFLRISAIRRIKFNLTPRTPSNLSDHMHVDCTDASNFYSAVYYVNDNNGGTLFEEGGLFIPSVANRLLVFEGQHKHTNVTCTDTFVRMVINFVFYAPNDDIFNLEHYPSKKS